MLMAGLRLAFCTGQPGHSVKIFLCTDPKWLTGAGDDAAMRI